jgi:Csc2 Crispr
MSLFRELAELESTEAWGDYFKGHFGRECIIPNHLCIACWNCALFGGLETGRDAAGTFSRIRYFDTYSVEDGADCIATEDSEEGMGIGNQVYEDLRDPRTAATYHLYEYVKTGTTFPFLVIIESPTLLDVVGYLATIRRADGHGYGKYSANHGKFSTRILAVATGYPRFSVLDMLTWANEGNGALIRRFDEQKVRFDSLTPSVALFGSEIEELETKLRPEFAAYAQALLL